MSGVRRKLLPINGGPGSILPTKFGNEELGGKFGRGFSRLAVALAPPFSEAFNANGGLGGKKKAFSAKMGGCGQMTYTPLRNRPLEETGCPRKPTPRAWGG